MLKKIIGELSSLGWTLAGTGLVLITLSGDTQKWGIYMSIAALVVHVIGFVTSAGDDE
jgi:hypothetical protein